MCVFASFWWIFATFRLPQLKINKKRPPHSAFLLAARSALSFLPSVFFSLGFLFVHDKLSIFAGAQNPGILYTGSLRVLRVQGLLRLLLHFLEPVPSAFCLCMYCETDFESTSALSQLSSQSRRSRRRYLSNYLLFLRREPGTSTRNTQRMTAATATATVRQILEAPGLELE